MLAGQFLAEHVAGAGALLDRLLPTSARHLIEQVLGRLAADDPIGHSIGMALVRISLLSDAAGEQYAGALLHYVRRFVRGRVQIGRFAERDLIAGRVRLRSHDFGSLSGSPTNVSLGAAENFRYSREHYTFDTTWRYRMYLMLTRWSGRVYGLGLGLIALSACTQPPDGRRSGVVFSPAPAAALTIDATTLTEPQFLVRDPSGGFLVGWLQTNVEQTVTLAPGTYYFVTPGGRFQFSVDTTGSFLIGSEVTGFASIGDGGRTLVVRGYDFTFDATSLSEPEFVFFGNSGANWSSDSAPTEDVRTVTLLPGGSYSFMTYGGSISFQIGSDGSFENTSSCPSCFTATGASITVHGFPYTFDPTELYEPEFAIFGSNGRLANFATPLAPTSTPRSYELLPGGTYYFMTYGSSVPFQFEGSGQFANLSDCPTCFEVNTANVTVHGVPFTFDGSALTEPDFALIGTNGRLANWSSPRLPTTSPHTFTLLPGGAYYFMTAGGTVAFRPSGTGVFEDLSGCPGCWDISGLSVRMRGFTFQIQGNALFETELYIHGHSGRRPDFSTPWLPTCATHSVTLLPGEYSLRTHSLMQLFSVTTAGVLVPTPAPAAWLSVDPGGTQLTLLGHPVSLEGTWAGESTFSLLGIPHSPANLGSFSTGQSYCLNLTPGAYAFRNERGGPLAQMVIANDGTITTDDPGVSATLQGALCANPRCQIDDPPDRTAPVLDGCVNLTVAASPGLGGAQVSYEITAHDEQEGSLLAFCDILSGSFFSMGESTLVTCSAADSSGNQGTCTFSVQVQEPSACHRDNLRSQDYWRTQCNYQGPGGTPPDPMLTPEILQGLLHGVEPELQSTCDASESTCNALNPAPYWESCEQACQQYAGLLLNIASARLPASCCTLEGSAVEAAAHVAALITTGRCNEANELADELNRGCLFCEGGH
jgi:hypothetical protein